MNSIRDETGFTLTEMLIVITIVAASLALSLPYSLKSGTARRLDAATDTIAARLRETRSLAISANAPKALTVDLDANTLSRDGGEPLSTLPSSIRLTLTTADDLIIEHQGRFGFFANGGATGGTLLLSDEDMTRRIAINWLTGAIVISNEPAP